MMYNCEFIYFLRLYYLLKHQIKYKTESLVKFILIFWKNKKLWNFLGEKIYIIPILFI